MKRFIVYSLLLTMSVALADTPPPGSVKLRGGSDNTVIGNVGDSLKVNVTSGGGGTVNQGTGGISPWSVYFLTPPTMLSQQSGSWSVGRTWNLGFSTDKVDISGSSVSVSSFPGSLSVTQGTSPWVVSGTVTSDIGTTGGLALDSSLATINTTLGSPAQEHTIAGSPSSVRLSDGTAFYTGFKAGDSIGNTAFGISGTLPAFAATPTFNIGTTGGIALDSTLSSFQSANHTDLGTINTTLGSPFQAGGSIGNTAFIANAGTNLNTSLLALESGGHLASIDTKLTAPLITNATLQTGSNIIGKVDIDQTTPGTTNGVQVNAALPAGTNSIGQVTANAGTNLNTSALNLETTQSAFKSANHTDLGTINTTLGSPMQNSGGSVTANIGTSGSLALDATLTNGNQKVQGNIASGTSDSGNPVKAGAVFNTTQPTVTNGQRVDVQGTSRGGLIIAKGADGFSIDNTAFTANAGTNLNTSALNLESTQSAFKTANHSDLTTINTTLGSPMQNSGGSVTANAGTGTFTVGQATAANLNATVVQGTSPWVSNVSQFGGSNVVTGTGASGVGIPRVTVSNDSNILATQSGAWTTGRTWNLSSGADSVASVQSGSWTVTSNQGTSPWVSNVSQFGGSNVVTGTGTSGSGIPRVTVSNDSNVLATQSGTWTVQQGTPPWSVVGNVASAASDSGNPVKVGAIANTTLPTVTAGQRVDNQADLNGRLYVDSVPLDGAKASYVAATAAAFAPATTPTDICTLTGSASKTIRIVKVSVSATQTNGGAINIFILKRSTADTGGTSTALTAVPLDSNDSAATATALAYTANPTTGTLVGNILSDKWEIPTANLNTFSQPRPIAFGDIPIKAIVLRGTSQVAAVNLGGTTIAGGSFHCTFYWTEE